jgi:hypothetical protein
MFWKMFIIYKEIKSTEVEKAYYHADYNLLKFHSMVPVIIYALSLKVAHFHVCLK